ncbi:NAD(P)H-dependent oxidoreductase [Myroides albus]|uniref:NAD(P)H-dependent oxidoreductase n=1 Tax=Myroides albus TaxID=2562892 RepID=UPI0021598293|nr:NAD(P)H-dependent oxidoreductase [Myroides albus]UVD80000.1 NAD(P)H-dependent oxidoreductase [Myroides albus]
MNKITIINGHPDYENFNQAITNTYKAQALAEKCEVKLIAIRELDFNPNLKNGYRKRMELEPDLLQAIHDIKWCDHLVIIHPIWWLSMPAILKGFFDRAFLPSITFKHTSATTSEGLLQGKSARIINTAGDLSFSVYETVYKSSGIVQLEKGILEYCGIAPISKSFIGPLNTMTAVDRLNLLNTIPQLVQQDIQ